MASKLAEIGQRLHAYRIGAGLSANDVADRLSVSRATVYRLESHGIDRIGLLERVASLLGVSLETLLGVGVEYIASAVTYFERLRQLESGCARIFVAFAPVFSLLTSAEYDEALRASLMEQCTGEIAGRPGPQIVGELMDILMRRKAAFQQAAPNVTVVLSAADIMQYARFGMAAADSSQTDQRAKRSVAARELEVLARHIAHPPIGIQIGILFEPLPSTGFALIRRDGRQVVVTSPFRLAPPLNIQRGIAMISEAPEAVKLYSRLASDLWSGATTGADARDFVLSQAHRA
ncbi:helix-turn-helix transcriptional regulator [Castellaniella sp. GW247-6E4]|uniref:helix-turn-helix transcriptional regulator n=1 Tax=Castellaniella sp. GW247-6E4 TaxID=3140380 RepID=UPI00331611F6